MTNTIDTATIESLRAFADAHHATGSLSQHEKCIAFYNLCTSALRGEEWAIDRVTDMIDRLGARVRDCGPLTSYEFESERLRQILATDTSRP